VTGPPVLALDGVGKRFGRVAALTDASLAVRPGTVHALLGENGAGKTTLMRIAFGMYAPDVGAVRVRGSLVHLGSPGDAIALGIGMVHQHFTLVPAMTVAENLAVGGRGRFDSAVVGERVRDIGRATGLSLDPNERVGDLSVSAQQRLELMKALSRNAEILIFDEPTAVLAPDEANDLLRRVRQLADGGRAIILITHKLREALSIADDITVLRRGATVMTSSRADIDQAALIGAMLGQRDVRAPVPRRTTPSTPRETVIAARAVSVADARGVTRIRGATLDVHGGEIVGIAAVEGSGHRELLRALAGRIPIIAGTLDLPAAVGFVPEDRHRDGLVLGMSLAENYALRGAGSRRGLIRWRQVSDAASQIVHDYDVRAPDERVAAGTLSGGNQQKFILGRELHGSPSALVIESPTWGLDVRAAAYVQDQLLHARSHGVAIVLHSADLDEVVALADRAFVVYGGTVREVTVRADVIGRAMLGITE
jgi:general nucleoside transport system ATP-binding protein